jgi:hypothetical protein
MRKRFYTGAYVSIAAILLSCLGAISVGFATWIISQGDTSTVTGDIDADKVNTNINGVAIIPSCFTMGHYYYDASASGSTVTHSTTGTLSYDISITKNLIDKTIIPNNTLTLSMTLTFANESSENLPIFKSAYLSGVNYGGSAFNDYVLADPYQSVTIEIEEDVSGSGAINKTLSFVFSQQLVARYYSAMRGGKFYLNVEAI